MLETLACLKRKERCAVFKAEWSNTNSSWYFFLLNQLLIPRNQSGLSGMKVTTVGPVMSSAGSDRRCFASPANHNTLYSGQPHFTLYLFSDMPNVKFKKKLRQNSYNMLYHFMGNFSKKSPTNILKSPKSTSPLSPLKTDTKRQKLLEILREALTNTEKHKR